MLLLTLEFLIQPVTTPYSQDPNHLLQIRPANHAQICDANSLDSIARGLI